MSRSVPPMVIWYVSKCVAPPAGLGPGGRGYKLMRELAALGHDCVIIASDANHLTDVPALRSSALSEERDGLRLLWLRTFKAPTAKSGRRILSWLHFEWRLFRFRKRKLPNPDVVIVSSLSLLTIVNGVLLRHRYGARLVFEIRDIWPLTLTEEGGFSERNPLVKLLGFLERWGYRKADTIVGTMPNLGAHVQRVLGWPRPVQCVPMGFARRALDQVESLPAGYLETHIPPGKFVIGYAGTIGITNALEPLFAAVQILQDTPRVHFIVLGDGPLLSEFKRRFEHLPNLTFAPRVPKGAVQRVLATCDLLYLSVHESRVWCFGQSFNKLIDYMLAGKPIVASYSGYPSMIDEAACSSSSLRDAPMTSLTNSATTPLFRSTNSRR